jgi:hypothetical protein
MKILADQMRKTCLCLVLMFAAFALSFADAKDFSFHPLRSKLRYKEDFFHLYNQWLYPDTDSVGRNVYFLELAYALPFDHPIKALTPITNENQYGRYQAILMMKICWLLTQEYINYGYLYMKEHIYFFNDEFLKEYKDGYDIAEFYFDQAGKYWDQAVDYAKKADSFRGYRTGLIAYEDDVRKILDGVTDYYKVVRNLKSRISRNRNDIAKIEASR